MKYIILLISTLLCLNLFADELAINDNKQNIGYVKTTSTIKTHLGEDVKYDKLFTITDIDENQFSLKIDTTLYNQTYSTIVTFDKPKSTWFALKHLLGINLNPCNKPQVRSKQVLEKIYLYENQYYPELLLFDVIDLIDMDENNKPILRVHTFIDKNYLRNIDNKSFNIKDYYENIYKTEKELFYCDKYFTSLLILHY